jgi:DNA-binding GntR family transcriptional regulator
MPKWRQVEALILQYIRNHGLRNGARLPPDHEFAKMAGCSTQPVVRAMDNLEIRGIVCRGSGSPTTVVDQPPLIVDQEFSFTHSAWSHGHELTSRLLEVGRRLTHRNDEVERRAQKALGLRRPEPFYVITRLRLLDGSPRVLHRAYLNPAHFPPAFFTEHDFARESLVELYNASGFRIEARQTTLRARRASEEEAAVLKCGAEPLLETEQQTEAVRVNTGELITLEYLQALYFKWEYQVANRRSPTGATHEQP